VLAPHDRSLLLDGLRPDPGYVLDVAVGTSFSLDVDALLLAPLSFALFDVDAGSAQPDPLAVLAGVRSYADRMAIYTDAAHISPPPKERPLFQMLEQTILPVAQTDGAFHPKVWVLRFRSSDGGPMTHRALVLSRNLTFDRSWDTVLRLDEAISEPARTPNSDGLVDFLRTLSDRRPSRIVDQLLETLPTVAFKAPAPFTGLRFWSMTATGEDPLADASSTAREVLTISPFADVSRLGVIAPGARRRAFVSRQDTLDKLGGRALSPWDERFVLHGEAVQTDQDETPSDADNPDGTSPGTTLSGLHAKLFLFDDGHERRLFTGSANATSAAVHRNVEFLVELRSTDSATRLDAVLGEKNGETNLRRLLVLGHAAQDEPLPETAEEAESRRLEGIARRLAEGGAVATARQAGDAWVVDVGLAGHADLGLARTDWLRARLVTTAGAWVPMETGGTQITATLRAGKASRVTSLIAVTLGTGAGLDVPPHQFVLAAALRDAPADREDQLLLDLIPDARSMMRLLFMLLADGQAGADGAAEVRRILAAGVRDAPGDWELGLPLFESLVRSFARDPERLATIASVIDRLRSQPDTENRFPEGFLAMWQVFSDALPPDRPTTSAAARQIGARR
jgi:hypothetical protein